MTEKRVPDADRTDLGESEEHVGNWWREGAAEVSRTFRQVDPNDAEFERVEQRKDNQLRRQKELVLFAIGLLALATVSVGSIWILLRQSSSGEEKLWASRVLAAVVGAVVGWSLRGQSGRS